MVNKIKVRIAPSPTGYLHIGTARTALFNWLFAQKNDGVFVLRIEDTDLERSDPKFEEDIKESLRWLGLEWDEFSRQSERINIYKKYLEELIDQGKAFWCFHSLEELEREKKEQMARKEPPRHICRYKYKENIGSYINGQKNGIIRLRVDENSTRIIHFNDIIKGTIEWSENLIGDLSLAKNLETPLYNFAVVVDDYEMKISHVIRGEDHISNTPKQILIQEALGFKRPEYAHLPLILGEDRTKLSKRHGAVAISQYRELGYLPEAIINFIALLGWRPKQKGQYFEDIYSIDSMISLFDLKDVQKSPAVFDIKKLNWMNRYYIHQLTPEQFKNLVIPFLLKSGIEKVNDEIFDKATHLMSERMEKLSEIKKFDYFFEDPEYDKQILKWRNASYNDISRSLNLVKEVFELIDWKIFDKDYIQKKLDKLAEIEFNNDRGMIYWPLRVALTGKEGSPDPIDILEVLEKDVIMRRINKALKILSS